MHLILLLLVHVLAAPKNPATQCGTGSHWVSAHHRRAYIKGDGTVVKEADVRAHCRKNPTGYEKWEPKLKKGVSKFAGNNSDKPGEWATEERERVLDALSEIPDFLKENFDTIYRMKNVENPDNPASVSGRTIVLYDAAFASDQNLAQVLAHEMSHPYFNRLSEREQQSFRDAAKWVSDSNNPSGFRPGRSADQFFRSNGMLSYHVITDSWAGTISLTEVIKLAPGKTTKDQLLQRFGKPDRKNKLEESPKGESWEYREKGLVRLTLSFDEGSDVANSWAWGVSDKDPEKNLKNAQSRFPDATWNVETTKWINPHASPYECFYKDENLGISLEFNLIRKAISAKEFFKDRSVAEYCESVH